MKIDWVIPAKEWQEMLIEGRGWELMVSDWLPMSLNDLLKNSYQTYAAERRWIQHFLGQKYRDIPPAIDKRAIQMVIVKKTANTDDAPNLDARSKGTVDAMKRLGMIRDDNARWLDWHHVTQVKGPVKGTLIRLWEI